MSRHSVASRASFLVLFAAALFAGCSPVAWAPRETPHTSSIDIGERVTLLLRDGSVFSGTYVAVRELSDDEYATYYAAGTKDLSSTLALPSLGQIVTYTTSLDESRVWKGELLGFDESSLLVSNPQNNEVERVYFSSLGSLSGKEGSRIRRMSLRGMYLNGQIPLKTAVVVAAASGNMRIPVSEIEKIRVAPPGDETGTSVAWIDARGLSWSTR